MSRSTRTKEKRFTQNQVNEEKSESSFFGWVGGITTMLFFLLIGWSLDTVHFGEPPVQWHESSSCSHAFDRPVVPEYLRCKGTKPDVIKTRTCESVNGSKEQCEMEEEWQFDFYSCDGF